MNDFHDFAHRVWCEEGGFNAVVDLARDTRRSKRRVFFIGNGASASIASHMAADWCKTARFASQCFNDGALLTCLGNDLGYDQTFAFPVSVHGREGDILFAISSSGSSANIVAGVRAAKAQGMTVVTLSGFKPDNAIRGMGHINFYVPSEQYGHVEVAHLAILHAILDQIVELT